MSVSCLNMTRFGPSSINSIFTLVFVPSSDRVSSKTRESFIDNVSVYQGLRVPGCYSWTSSFSEGPCPSLDGT